MLSKPLMLGRTLTPGKIAIPSGPQTVRSCCIIPASSNLGSGLCFYSRLWVVLFFFVGVSLLSIVPGVALGEPEPRLGQGWKKVYPVARLCEVIAHRLRVRGPPILYMYHLRTSPFTRLPCFLHLASSIFLHFTFFISHPPPLPDPHAPTLPPKDTSSVTIPPGEGSGNFLNASGSLTIRPTTKRRIWPCVSFPLALTYFISFLSFFPRHLVLDVCNTWVLALENWGVT